MKGYLRSKNQVIKRSNNVQMINFDIFKRFFWLKNHILISDTIFSSCIKAIFIIIILSYLLAFYPDLLTINKETRKRPWVYIHGLFYLMQVLWNYYSHSSFYTVHYIQKRSKQRLFVYWVLGNSFHFSLFLNYFAHPSPSSSITWINSIYKSHIPNFQRD